MDPCSVREGVSPTEEVRKADYRSLYEDYRIDNPDDQRNRDRLNSCELPIYINTIQWGFPRIQWRPKSSGFFNIDLASLPATLVPAVGFIVH